MRILLDYRPALRERTGVGEYVHQVAVALARGVDDRTAADRVTLFTSSWKDRPDRTALADVEIIDRRVPVRLLNLLWHRLRWPSVELLTGMSFDVVHSPHPLLLPARRAAQVVTVHDLDFLLHPERTRAEIRRDYPLLAGRHTRLADRVVVPSRYTAGLVERHLGVPAGRIALCPHGAPSWPPRAGPPRDGYILFVGTLEPRKNVARLLGAYGRLLERWPGAPELLLAGKAVPEVSTVLGWLDRPPLHGRVTLAGYVSPDARRALYAGARLLVLPSLDEGFGLPVLEAMATGVPVVASDRGALPEVVGDAGLLIDPEDEGALAAAMERMLSDPVLARSAIDRGLARARLFSWEAAARALRAAYEAAVATRQERKGG